MSNKEHATSYTGRDGYIMGQALVYAIAHIQSLPREKQEYSNMCDMCIIARESGSSFFLPSYVISVFAHTGIKVDLWPEGEPIDERGIAQREIIDTSLATWQEFIAKREAVKENDGIEFLENGSNPAPLSEPEFIDMTAEDEASIKGAA